MSINYSQLKGKVEYCLDKYPDTRNSDKELFIKLIQSFPKYNQYLINNDLIKLESIKNLPSESDISRIRRKLNEEGKYLPTDQTVSKERGRLEKEWHLRMSPSNPSRG